MKITSIKAHMTGVAGPGGHAPSPNWIFVDVHTDEGISGIGEATTEYHEHAVVAMIERHLAPLLIGQGSRHSSLVRLPMLAANHSMTNVLCTTHCGSDRRYATRSGRLVT